MLYQNISPVELQQKMSAGEQLKLIDVREVIEYEIARIAGAELLPLSEFAEWHARLDRDEPIVFMCHHGVRSAQVCQYLAQQGFNKLSNLSGGIDAWSVEVDRRVARY